MERENLPGYGTRTKKYFSWGIHNNIEMIDILDATIPEESVAFVVNYGMKSILEDPEDPEDPVLE